MATFQWRVLLLGWLSSAVLLAVLWLWQRRHKDAGISDVGWALSLAGLALAAALSGEGAATPRWLIGVVGGVWGLRLGLHLLFDRVIGHREDGRYRFLREHWGERADAKFFGFFQLQAVVATLLALPFFVAVRAPEDRLVGWQLAGLALFVVAKSGEVLADRQLARFRADASNRGRTCREGLWRWSRHPNYFFEWLIWWSFALLALPAPGGAWALVAPLVMYVMITRVSGIPYTEAQSLRSRGEDYRDYQRSTSAFFPLPPRSHSQSVRRPAADPPNVSDAPA